MLNGKQGINIALVDLNNDGWLDIFLTTFNEGNFVVLNPLPDDSKDNSTSRSQRRGSANQRIGLRRPQPGWLPRYRKRKLFFRGFQLANLSGKPLTNGFLITTWNSNRKPWKEFPDKPTASCFLISTQTGFPIS